MVNRSESIAGLTIINLSLFTNCYHIRISQVQEKDTTNANTSKKMDMYFLFRRDKVKNHFQINFERFFVNLFFFQTFGEI